MKSAWEYTNDTQIKVSSICKTLENIGFSFVYEKVFADGSFFGLVSNPSIFKVYNFSRADNFCDMKANASFFRQAFLNMKGRMHYFLSPKELFNQDLTKFLLENNIGEILNFTKKTEDYTEIWLFFASTKADQNTVAYCLNNINQLEDFIYYFNQQTKDLRSEPNLNIYQRPKLHQDYLTHIKQPYADQVNLFTADLQAKYFNIDIVPGKSTTLTLREVECLYNLYLGKSIKEIALAMGIADRTVEDFIKNIKKKTGIYSRSALVTLVLNNDLSFIRRLNKQ